MTKPMFWDTHYNNDVKIKTAFYKQIKSNLTMYNVKNMYTRTCEEQWTAETVNRHLHFSVDNEAFNSTLQEDIKFDYM
jgi:hypothetical protein